MRLIKTSLLAAAVISASGCATKSFVEESLGRLEERQNAQEQRLDAQEQRLDELSLTSRQALERATDAGVLAEGRFLYDVVLTDDGITFETGNATLTSSAQGRLTELAERLKADNKNVYLEIQGHTDSTGAEAYNQTLGLQRAEAVRRYLRAEGVALDRMATISYGEEVPVGSNDTAEGRAMNRRVVIVVLD